jgi:acetylornithine deacetylase/succinyl-diaminopimelate desuccinylase-like protein
MTVEREMLEQLVAISSESGHEQDIGGYIAERCQAFGRVALDLGSDVAVHIPGEDARRAFLLNGHTDTVPATAQWQEDPLALRASPEDEDRLIGLGASDMKAGLATMLAIGQEAADRRPPCDTWLLFTSNEETDGSGAARVADWFDQESRRRYQALGGLILEPTNASFVGVGHRGDTLWNVKASGSGGHASQHFEKDTPPIEKLSHFIAVLPEIREQWSQEYSDEVLGRPSINPTIIQAGKTDNVVPVRAEATLNLRVTPQLLATLGDRRKTFEDSYDLTIEQAWQPQPTICGSHEHIYRAAKKALPDASFQAFPGATDQVAFEARNIPMLIFGPGDIDAMHQPDEWVRMSHMTRCKEAMELIMRHFAEEPA